MWHLSKKGDANGFLFKEDVAVQVSEDVVASAFSPDSLHLATMALNDRNPKIWYRRQKGSKPTSDTMFDFVYLPHGSPVRSFQWRHRIHPTPKSGGDDGMNVILTLCNDQICRIWSQYPNDSCFLTFNLCVSIDPLDLKITFPSPPKSPITEHFHTNELASVYWLTNTALTTTVALRNEQMNKFLPSKSELTIGSKSKKLADTLSEYPDMLIAVQKTGAVIIWGIQNLSSSPIRAPRFIILMKTDAILPISDYDIFQGALQMFCDRQSLCKSAVYFPAELYVLTQRRSDGLLHCYTMDLDDFFTGQWISPRLNLVCSWSGHRSPIKQLHRHPQLPLCVTIDQTGDIYAQRTAPPKKGLRTTYSLTHLASVPHSAPFNDSFIFSWIITAPILVLYDGSQISLVHVWDHGLEEFGTLKDLPSGEKVVFIDTYADLIPSNSHEQHTVRIIALSRSGKAFIWKSVIQGQFLVSVAFDYGSSLPLSGGVYKAVSPLEFVHHQTDAHSLGSYVVKTLSETGEVMVWYGTSPAKDSPDGGEYSWEMVSSFKMLDESDAKTATVNQSSNKFALVHKDGSISIWTTNICGRSIIKEWSASFDEPVLNVDWFLSSDWQHLLAVVTKSKVRVFIQERLESCDSKVVWRSVSQIAAEPDNPILFASWLHHGAVVVSFEKNTKTFSKWIQSDEDVPANVFSTSSHVNGRLQDHNPKLMIQYLLWGKRDVVQYGLAMLYRFVNYCATFKKPINDIPTPLWKMFYNEDGDSAKNNAQKQLLDLDSADDHDEQNAYKFSKSDANNLRDLLKTIQLPHLSSSEQDMLSTLIETFTNLSQYDHSVDENGVKFLSSMEIKMNSSYTKTQPKPCLSHQEIAWAFSSDSEEKLLEICTSTFGGKMLWEDAKRVGVGLWVRNYATLRRIFEVIARNQYMGREDSKDPVACALYYLALKKKNVLFGLWKLANAHPEQAMLLKFLANNFDEDRWQNAALKNGFALLGKQRYEYAASFFLLAGKIKDAANICIKQLNDIQLAITIIRVYEGDDGPILKDVLENTLIPDAIKSGDRWLTSMLFQILKRWDKALYATLYPLEDLETTSAKYTYKSDAIDPLLVPYYYHLQKSFKSVFMVEYPNVPYSDEFQFVCQAAQTYHEMGYPALSLNIIRTYKLDALPEFVIESGVVEANTTIVVAVDAKASGGLDWGELDSKPKASGGLDWGELDSKPKASGGLDWGDMKTTLLDDPIYAELDPKDKALLGIEDEPQTLTIESETKSEVLKLTTHDYNQLLIQQKSIIRFSRSLVMRIVHTIFSSAHVMSEYKDNNDLMFRDYFVQIRKGLVALCDITTMAYPKMEHIINQRCRETNALTAYMEIIPLRDNINDYAAPVSGFLEEESNMLSNLAFEMHSSVYTKSKFQFLDRMSKAQLAAFMIWDSKGTKDLLSDSVICKTVVAAFVSLSMTSLYFKEYNRSWWLIGMCDRLFDALLKGKGKTLGLLVADILAGREPIAHPDIDSDVKNPDVDDEMFDEFGLPLYRKGSPVVECAELMVSILCLKHIGFTLEHCLDQLKEVMGLNPAMDDFHGYLVESVIKGFSRYIYVLQEQLVQAWTATNFEPSKIKAYLYETNMIPLWDFLRRTIEVQQMIHAMEPPKINNIESASLTVSEPIITTGSINA